MSAVDPAEIRRAENAGHAIKVLLNHVAGCSRLLSVRPGLLRLLGSRLGHDECTLNVMTQRRTFGAIDELPSGNFRARWRQDGERVMAPMTFATEVDAHNFLLTVEADLMRGRRTQTNTGTITLEKWMEEWLDNPGKGQDSRDRDRQGIRAFPSLLQLELGQITRRMVQQALKARSSSRKFETVKRDFSALRACLNAAEDAEIIPVAPIPRKPALPPDDSRIPVQVSDEEVEALAAAVPRRYRALILVFAFLGCRWGEAIGLRICDIDFLKRQAAVGEEVVKELSGHVRIVRRSGRRTRTGKTMAATRTRPVPTELLEELAHHIATYCPNASSDGLLFVGPKGGILRRSFEARHFKSAAVKAGVAVLRDGDRITSDLVIHDLRHHAITEMVEAGIELAELKEWFGHKAVEMVLRYTHATRTSAKAAQEKMDEWYAAKSARRCPQQEAG